LGSGGGNCSSYFGGFGGGIIEIRVLGLFQLNNGYSIVFYCLMPKVSKALLWCFARSAIIVVPLQKVDFIPIFILLLVIILFLHFNRSIIADGGSGQLCAGGGSGGTIIIQGSIEGVGVITAVCER
jgi:hypothetical protein